MFFKVCKRSVHVKKVMVVLRDFSTSYEHSHPLLVVDMEYLDDFGPVTVSALFKFQRHLFFDGRSGHWKPAEGNPDTCKRWTTCYGGHLELEEAGEVKYIFRDQGHSLCMKDRVRVAFQRKMARAAKKVTLTVREATGKEPGCELMLAVAAMEAMKLDVEWRYQYQGGGWPGVELWKVDKRYANAQAQRDSEAA